MLNFMAWQMLLGMLPVLPIALVYPTRPPEWDATYTLLLLYTGAVSTAGGFMLWIAVLRWLTAGAASLNMLAIPVIALVSSMLFFGERLTPLEWSGIALSRRRTAAGLAARVAGEPRGPARRGGAAADRGQLKARPVPAIGALRRAVPCAGVRWRGGGRRVRASSAARRVGSARVARPGRPKHGHPDRASRATPTAAQAPAPGGPRHAGTVACGDCKPA